ncbi:glycerophosphodiester phosphodiesterase [Cohaesibacter intestini]|uniref:glycerophosphodiester phosphodiesterase n=1 Tax=Cohaesibacter intestini TaxID=2211145 RepID=UPI001300A431|nr:glycerophosphodiester phosphodiesterase family protein [Cohaesibacter intestini]
MTFAKKIAALGWPNSRFDGPAIIGHRGACHHATENSLDGFVLASKLGADMWELDVRLTADGTCVVSHDDDLSRVFGVSAKLSELTIAQLEALEGVHVPTFDEVITLAILLEAGLYIEIKADGAGPAALALLQQSGFTYAALGSFDPTHVAQLAALDCPYPLSVLVRIGDDPFEQAANARADAIHPCWERASDRPDQLLTPDLMQRAKDTQLPIILWHEERPDVIKAVMAMDVFGVCTDRPELLVPYPGSPSRPTPLPKGPEVVCHRGANKLAPENTLPAALMTFEQGFDWLELDIRQSLDGDLFVIHDETLDRTTNGRGPVASHSAEQLRALDAGSWFDPRFTGTKIPTFEEIIDLAKAHQKNLYVEIKQADPAKVLDLIKAKDFMAHCFFWSFNRALSDEVRRLAPDARIMARTLDFPTISEAITSVGAEIIEVNMAEEQVEKKATNIHTSGAKLMLCYNGSDRTVMERMLALAPDLVNLDQLNLWKEVWYQAQRRHAKETVAP